jgi:hypothetical protein
MLYQLSYASAAQTKEYYQNGHPNCKGFALLLSTSMASPVEKPQPSGIHPANP